MYLLYFFYYTFKQIHNKYIMNKLKHVFPMLPKKPQRLNLGKLLDKTTFAFREAGGP